ncbi:terminase small subunit [Lactococcus insecticola]|uniref:Terminase n=1 Tax=Pseudolactococcus insecticola TaxID=2709158 RepID=A0A6A0B462_9LACT|nr:terminase small subunit [Lactococcus insecticola]GFH39836.1 terminase [Lactococcus insecticola]
MTPKQRKFADNYIKTGNATQSAIDAGYSKKTANQIGNENLLKPVIRQYIDSHLEQLSKNTIADAEMALAVLSSILTGKELEQVVTQSGEVVEVPPNNVQKTRAAAEILKRYPVAQEIKLDGGIKIVFEDEDEDDSDE